MDFDVIIIGSGAGGGMTALSLCEQGFKVGLIERGPRFDRKKDFVQNYPDWETRHNPLASARQPEQTIDTSYRTPQPGNTTSRSSFIYHRVHGVGGSTLHYQGEAHRFAEHAFEQHSRYGWGLNWPIGYTDLQPYYHKAEQLLGVAGIANNPTKPNRGDYPTPAHPLSARSLLLAKSASAAGMTLLQNPLALPSKSTDGRTPCQHSGGCNFGCVFGAKSSIDNAIIPRAEKTGNLTLLSNTRVLKLNLNSQGEIESVACKSGRDKASYSAKRYVLAGGALETPRLMLISSAGTDPTGFANQQDQVGRYLMETLVSRLQLDIKLDIHTYRGPPLDSRIWNFCKPKDNQSGGFVLGSAGYLYPGTGPVLHAKKLPGIGHAHKQRMRETFGKSIYLFGIGEQQPQAENRVSLSQNKDSSGSAKLNVHCAYSERDLTTLKRMQTQLRAWQAATPNSKAGHYTDTKLRSSATHVAGTCRMGADPKAAVVDATGRVHGKRNCYITDGSVMPTQGNGDSPSLTIQALALRTAEFIAQDLKQA